MLFVLGLRGRQEWWTMTGDHHGEAYGWTPEQKIEHLKRNAEADIDERLDASMKRILQQNRKLAEELHMHVQETSVLQRDKKKLEEDNKVLTRELDIKNEAEQEYAKRGLKQAQELYETALGAGKGERGGGRAVWLGSSLAPLCTHGAARATRAPRHR